MNTTVPAAVKPSLNSISLSSYLPAKFSASAYLQPHLLDRLRPAGLDFLGAPGHQLLGPVPQAVVFADADGSAVSG